MDNEQFPAPASAPNLADLQAKYDSLQQLMVGAFILLLILAGTLCMFFQRQASNLKNDLGLLRQQTTNMVAQLKLNEPFIDELLRKFQDYGRTHPDFMPILAKYGAAPTNRPAAPTPLSPGSALPKKK